MRELRTYLYYLYYQTVIQINVNGLTSSIKRKRFSGFAGGSVVENLPATAGHTGSSPGLGRSHMPQSN